MAVFVVENGDSDIVVDNNGFILIPGEYEHSPYSMWRYYSAPDLVKVHVKTHW
jgi:hypothetical protein